MTEQTLRHPELAALLGDRYTESEFERGFYRRDLAAVPGFLARLVARTLPDGIAAPVSAEEVSGLLRYAAGHGVPITPRAAATTAFWNAVPVRRGIVLDLNRLRGIVGLDPDARTVRVRAATRFDELDAWLRRRGFTLLAYPTSAPAATVGGWLNMEGYGIGSLKYGPFAAHVVRAQVVLPGGEIVDAAAVEGSEFEPALFEGSEGTLGVVTELDLRVRLVPPATVHLLAAFERMDALAAVVRSITAGGPLPYYMHFAGSGYQSLLYAAGFEPVTGRAVLAVTYDGDEGEVSAGVERMAAIVRSCDGDILPETEAASEWDERFAALRLKRAGPSVLGAESWLPAAGLAAYAEDVDRLGAAQRLPIATYGTVIGPDLLTVMSMFPCDETRTVRYLLDLSLTRALFATAARHGGRPYGTGVWNTPYLRRSYTTAQFAERRARKQRFDPLGVLNPGKGYSPPLLLQPALFHPAMVVLAAVRRVAGGAS